MQKTTAAFKRTITRHDSAESNNFAELVREVVRNIQRGKTLPYMVVAKRAGNRRAARAVGTIMKNNYDPTVPCHRVIRSDGTLGGYNRGGSEAKRKLLKSEGVKTRY